MTINRIRRIFPTALAITLAAAGLVLASCSSTTSQSFNNVQNSRVKASQLSTDADFGKYDTLNAVEMGIFFPAHAETTVEDQERIRQIFREAFLSRLGDYTVVQDTAGPTTLTVEATLIDFRNATADDIMSVRRELRDMAVPGAMVFLMEMKDSRSERVLARAADSASAPPISTSAETPTDWTAVETAADHWAELFRQFVDENLKK